MDSDSPRVSWHDKTHQYQNYTLNTLNYNTWRNILSDNNMVLPFYDLFDWCTIRPEWEGEGEGGGGRERERERERGTEGVLLTDILCFVISTGRMLRCWQRTFITTVLIPVDDPVLNLLWSLKKHPPPAATEIELFHQNWGSSAGLKRRTEFKLRPEIGYVDVNV